MKYLHEYRDPAQAQKLLEAIHTISHQPWTLMEVCGGQTHSILKHGLDRLLPDTIELIHGPGCPVCVTPIQAIDQALAIARQPEVILTTFGDMLRVPGSQQDLLGLKAQGADIRMVYSPLEAVKLAQQTPDKQIVFFGVGFETTAPTTALAACQAKQLGLNNFFLLISHVRVPPVMKALLNSPNNRVQGFLAAGHVCSVMGYHEYLPLARQYRIPIVVTGFEPVDLLQGIFYCIQQLEQGHHRVENQYRRVVTRAGNETAQRIMQQVFYPVEQNWRGLGSIAESGLALRPEFDRWNALTQFAIGEIRAQEPEHCHSGEVLTGMLKPNQCPAFGKECTPEHPLGATMVSSEGACAAYYRYRPKL